MTMSEKEIEILRKEISSLQEQVEYLEKGWNKCWLCHKDILNLSIDMMDSADIIAEYKNTIHVKFNRELYDAFDDQIAQMVDLPELKEEV
jgi:PP-loop superfamily ATP-utilizing enzyme